MNRRGATRYFLGAFHARIISIFRGTQSHFVYVLRDASEIICVIIDTLSDGSRSCVTNDAWYRSLGELQKLLIFEKFILFPLRVLG